MQPAKDFQSASEPQHRLPSLAEIDVADVKSAALTQALNRLKDRKKARIHAGHTTRHTSHSMHKKGAW